MVSNKLAPVSVVVWLVLFSDGSIFFRTMCVHLQYLHKEEIDKCHAKFRRQFPGISVPYKLMIQKPVKKLQTTGSLLDKKHVVVKKSAYRGEIK